MGGVERLSHAYLLGLRASACELKLAVISIRLLHQLIRASSLLTELWRTCYITFNACARGHVGQLYRCLVASWWPLTLTLLTTLTSCTSLMHTPPMTSCTHARRSVGRSVGQSVRSVSETVSHAVRQLVSQSVCCSQSVSQSVRVSLCVWVVRSSVGQVM